MPKLPKIPLTSSLYIDGHMTETPFAQTYISIFCPLIFGMLFKEESYSRCGHWILHPNVSGEGAQVLQQDCQQDGCIVHTSILTVSKIPTSQQSAKIW